MQVLKVLLIVVFVMPILADAALEKRVPCWPGYDFTIAPPYGDPQCQFNEANDCGFPPPPLSVQPTQQDADRYTEVIQNETRTQIVGEVQRGGWQGTGQGSPSPCQASTKSTYNVKRVKQNQAAGKCVVSEKNCRVTIIDSAPQGGDGPTGTRIQSPTDLESAKRALLSQLESSVKKQDLYGEALFAAQALNQLGYAGDVHGIFTRAEELITDDIDAAASLDGIAGGTLRDARAEAAALQARLSALQALKAIAFAPVELASTGAGAGFSQDVPTNDGESFGLFAPVFNKAGSVLRTFGSAEQPTLASVAGTEEATLWQRFKTWAASFFRR